ncbi:hypothetical protein B0H13DRAFT_1864488 [Mycena leptocephala]|nr:hypothetical protein B0H13DRAFT_1864488 [Mycena leptocephala]
MKKAVSSRKPTKSTILTINSDEPYETLKAQILVKISDTLGLEKLDYADYDVSFTVPRQVKDPTQLEATKNYSDLVSNTIKIKNAAAAKIIIEQKFVGVSAKKENNNTTTDESTTEQRGRRKREFRMQSMSYMQTLP